MNKKSREKKSRIMNLIIRDMASRDWKIWIENFWLEEGVENPEKALREAIQDFLKSGTEASEAALSYACDCFNWGDAMSFVPDEVFARHGLRKISDYGAVDINVEHDEILCVEECEE